MRVVPKTSKELLTFGLTAPEYACQCSDLSCDVIFIAEKLLIAYKKFRYLVDTGLHINSGHRCVDHNRAVGGVKLSFHLVGYAIDVDAENLLQKYSAEEIVSFAKHAGFTFVKYYKTLGFFHLDVR